MKLFYELFFLGTSAFAGIAIDMDATGMQKAKIENRIKYYLDGPNLRIDVTKGGALVPLVIWRGGEKRIWIIDEANKKYVEMTEAQLKQFTASAQRMFQLSSPLMAQLPPAARRQLEAMVKPPVPKAPTRFKAAGSKQVKHWKCNRFVASNSANAQTEICTVPLAELGLKKSDLQAFDSLKAFAKDLGPLATQGTDYSQFGMETTMGFPVEAIHLTGVSGSQKETRINVVKVEKINRGAEYFRAPAGFEKTSVPTIPSPH